MDPAEPYHLTAHTLFDSSEIKLLHNYILAELVALARTRGLPQQPTVKFVAGLLDNADITTRWVDEQMHRAAGSLLMERRDKTYSLCDAVSFLLMRTHTITEALTTDHHFEQEGFRRLLRP